MSGHSSDFQGRYHVECRLGEGGVGEVFRAYDNRLRRHVALKRLNRENAPAGSTDPDAVHAQAWREAIHLAALQHPNVVTVHDFDVDEQGAFLIMELVEGETLEAVTARGAFPLEEFRVLAQQSLEGLAAAHQVGIYHCDLKPSNLMLNYNALGRLQIKLVDFGIAGFSVDLHTSAAVPGDANTILGTVEFMAPERFEHGPVNARTEIYSMGCIFYYALTGVDPFGGRTVSEVVASHLDSLIIPLEELRGDLPAPLCRWIMRLVSRRPEDRPESALAALAEFYALPVEAGQVEARGG